VDRNPIRQLPPALVNRIAAGEVIERPASVVKELIENAIDAGAQNILVEVTDGGRDLIRVSDDGGGIPADELALAFASHATSKLIDDDQLFCIRTMGFRGEALASIGSISQSRIVSRPVDQAHAHEISNNGGEITPIREAAANCGTTVEVRNLFFNTPARRKFLRSTSTEFGHISQTLMRLALPFESVSFKLIHNGRTTLELPPSGRLQRFLQAWPVEFQEHYLTIDAQFGDAALRGIVGMPELARPTPAHQYLYLNGRSIRDKFISHALREAYRGLTEPGRHPACVLLLELPPDEVDVNVHPTKSEVRFRDGTRIHGIIQTGVRQKLGESDLSPAAHPVRTAEEAKTEHRQSLQARLADFFRQPIPPQMPAIPLPSEAEGPPEQFPEESVPSRAPAIQLHNSYLVAQSEDGLIIIDQHALHERIIYEELLERVSRGPLESQRLLIPLTLPASPRQLGLLEQIRPLLARLGIEVEPFGPESVAVHAFASFLSRLDPGTFVAELLERGEQDLLDMHEEEVLHEVLDMMACKAAVKAGDPLSPSEIEALIARRAAVERSSNCPHGRPTTLRMSLKDLEKQFKRTGF
jgi:DNA mismatch repair protein MutL